ncbi:MAG: peptidylprolyl isomerase [Myxococcota bacterium]|nr:peptidylprolyl isomerase [Myxococcota bacterium]
MPIRSRFVVPPIATAFCALALAACGPTEPEPEPGPTPIPETTTPRDVVVLEIEGHGEVRFELLADLAPVSVAAFEKRVAEAYYDGVTFHRVVDDFMIQTGDPNTRNRDPRDDGLGGHKEMTDDEISGVTHVPGIVSLASRGQRNTNGSQFFIMVGDRPDLDARHTIIGRVVSGMDVVESVSDVETDLYGRHGPKHRPREDVVLTRVTIEPGGAPAASEPAAERPAEPATP